MFSTFTLLPVSVDAYGIIYVFVGEMCVCVYIGACSSPQQELTMSFLHCLPLGMDEEVITCSLAKV